MAKKGGKKGGSSAARSAAAKKGWETRRRGGGAAKGKAKSTAPTKAMARGGGKMGKAPVSKAKAAYKQAKSAAREARMRAGGRLDTKDIARGRKDPGAKNIRATAAYARKLQAKVTKMESTRGKYKPRRSR